MRSPVSISSRRAQHCIHLGVTLADCSKELRGSAENDLVHFDLLAVDVKNEVRVFPSLVITSTFNQMSAVYIQLYTHCAKSGRSSVTAVDAVDSMSTYASIDPDERGIDIWRFMALKR